MRRLLFLFSLFFLFAPALTPLPTWASSAVYFSPQDHLAERIIALIEKEKRSIYIAIYCLTHRDIADALIAAKNRGVVVEIVADPFSVKVRSPLAKMVKAGIPIFVWDAPFKYSGKGNRPRRPIMHDKFAIFGDKLIWTGSFNFTYDGDTSNRENAVLLDDPDLIKAFKEQFTALKLKGTLPYNEYLITRRKSK